MGLVMVEGNEVPISQTRYTYDLVNERTVAYLLVCCLKVLMFKFDLFEFELFWVVSSPPRAP